jgi:hypothetical protein
MAVTQSVTVVTLRKPEDFDPRQIFDVQHGTALLGCCNVSNLTQSAGPGELHLERSFYDRAKRNESKYAKIEKCSQDTAYRDILDLIDMGALAKDDAGGRSTSYYLTAT